MLNEHDVIETDDTSYIDVGVSGHLHSGIIKLFEDDGKCRRRED